MQFRILVLVFLLSAGVALGCESDPPTGAAGAGGEAGAAGTAGGSGGTSGQGGTAGSGATGGMGGNVGAGGSAGFAGAGGSAGSGATAGAGGSGGCPDRIGDRPTLTAQPVLDNAIVSPGDTIMLEVPVSAQTVLVRARAIIESTTAVGEAQVTTQGSEVVQIALPLDENPSVPRPSQGYIGFTLCDAQTNCLSGTDRTFVSYVRLPPTATRYFINVFDDGMINQGAARSSCYDALLFTLEDP